MPARRLTLAMRATKSMRVIGMMSGTSADGIDAALVEISGAPPRISAKFLAHHHVALPAPLRRDVLRIANGEAVTTAEISTLNFELGGAFARTALEACRAWKIPVARIDLIGSHGQTVYHQGRTEKIPSVRGAASSINQDRRPISSTLQLGEPSVIAERTGVTTIADFRPSDMAAGGQGAPLVPFVDYLLFRNEKRGRVALNIGGIANLSAIPNGAQERHVFAFDTGPGNMAVDALAAWATKGRARFDRDARIALSGRTIPPLLARLMREPYLRRKPPKTAGREQFGSAYADGIIAWAKRHRARPEDVVRTAAVFTSLSIADAVHRFVSPRMRVDDLIVAGGGAKNPLMMAQLSADLPEVQICRAEEFGMPSEAKEAFAFAILAYEAFHGRPNNLPSATGARRAAVMGKLVHGHSR
ncbi:MAG TPA: anhydro-N-acetylmuramic acid kinase [Candidatus Acidoferrales bacterium]|nr:anhydro-N-acetylmuramic acid kinase [Candidatus Acidoferrales bacterium]